jgi:hypothetical protein
MAKPERWMLMPIALLGLMPAASRILPIAMATGIRAAAIPWGEIALGCALAAIGGTIALAIVKNRAVAAACVLVTASFLGLKITAYPKLDRAATVRPLWISKHPACTFSDERGLIYGLEYYAGKALPPCYVLDPGPARGVR